eukprot:5656236-Amphidinium_carterae.3
MELCTWRWKLLALSWQLAVASLSSGDYVGSWRLATDPTLEASADMQHNYTCACGGGYACWDIVPTQDYYASDAYCPHYHESNHECEGYLQYATDVSRPIVTVSDDDLAKSDLEYDHNYDKMDYVAEACPYLLSVINYEEETLCFPHFIDYLHDDDFTAFNTELVQDYVEEVDPNLLHAKAYEEEDLHFSHLIDYVREDDITAFNMELVQDYVEKAGSNFHHDKNYEGEDLRIFHFSDYVREDDFTVFNKELVQDYVEEVDSDLMRIKAYEEEALHFSHLTDFVSVDDFTVFNWMTVQAYVEEVNSDLCLAKNYEEEAAFFSHPTDSAHVDVYAVHSRQNATNYVEEDGANIDLVPVYIYTEQIGQPNVLVLDYKLCNDLVVVSTGLEQLALCATVVVGWWCLIASAGIHRVLIWVIVNGTISVKALELAVAAQFVPQSKWILGSPPVIAKRAPKAQFDPGQRHANSCLFAALGHCMLARPPSIAQVKQLRLATAELWRTAPIQYLDRVAEAENMTARAYLDAIERDMWGSIHELRLWCYTFGLNLQVLAEGVTHTVGHEGGPLLELKEEHYTLSYAPTCSRWRKLAFSLRDTGNLRALLRAKNMDRLKKDACLHGANGRGGAPKLHQQEQNAETLVTLVPMMVGSPQLVARAIQHAVSWTSSLLGLGLSHNFHPHMPTYDIFTSTQLCRVSRMDTHVVSGEAFKLLVATVLYMVASAAGLEVSYLRLSQHPFDSKF